MFLGKMDSISVYIERIHELFALLTPEQKYYNKGRIERIVFQFENEILLKDKKYDEIINLH